MLSKGLIDTESKTFTAKESDSLNSISMLSTPNFEFKVKGVSS